MLKKRITNTLLPCLLLVVFVLQTPVIQAQNKKGIHFFEGTWAEAVAEAKKQNKNIFLDGYTTWCGPCKKMTKEIFTTDKVGNYYNEHFICVKKDMEKGEGIDLAKKYSINKFPTFVFF